MTNERLAYSRTAIGRPATAHPDAPWTRLPWLFMIMVVAPTVLAAIYYLLIAAPLYVSEAQFVASVKDAPQTAAGLGSVLATVGVSGGQEQTSAYEVQDYMTSRNVIEDLAAHDGLLGILGRPEADFLYRYPRPFSRPSIETLHKAFGRFVNVEYNLQTGVSTLTVRAFRPEDAHDLAEDLLNKSEHWVSLLNQRALADAVDQSENQVKQAKNRLADDQAQLTAYRNGERLVDPDKSASANLELLGRLEAEAAVLRAQRAAAAASAPQSPQLPILDQQIKAFEQQIDDEQTRAAGETNSLAPKMATYERLTLNQQLDAKALEAAFGELEASKLDASRQQIFLDRVVNPSVPDRAEEPHRLQMIGLILVSCLLAYSILALVLAGLREHQQR